MVGARSKVNYEYEAQWPALVVGVVAIVALTILVVWLIRHLRRAVSQSNQCLDVSTTSIDLTREAIEAEKQAMNLQCGANALLTELIAILKVRPPT